MATKLPTAAENSFNIFHVFMFISIAFGGAETPPDAAARGVARQGGSMGEEGEERGVAHSHKLRKERRQQTSELNAFEMENENYEKCQV